MLNLQRLLTAILFLSFPFVAVSQHYDSKTRFFGSMNINHYSKIQDNLKSTVYSFAFDDLKDRNDFDFYSPFFTMGFDIGISLPLSEHWTYELGYSRSFTKVKMTYQSLSNSEVSRTIKFTSNNYNVFGINYLLWKKQSIGFNLPLSTGRLYYKSEGITDESKGYEAISKRKLVSHFLSIDMGLNYQYNFNKYMAFRYSYIFNLFGGDVIITENSTLYFNSGRSTFSIYFKF